MDGRKRPQTPEKRKTAFSRKLVFLSMAFFGERPEKTDRTFPARLPPRGPPRAKAMPGFFNPFRCARKNPEQEVARAPFETVQDAAISTRGWFTPPFYVGFTRKLPETLDLLPGNRDSRLKGEAACVGGTKPYSPTVPWTPSP